MPRVSPTREGFRAAFRRPSLTFAEIAWRWTVGALAWTLFLFSIIEYLNTLPVTRGDKTLLGTRQPLLIGKAISHILRGSLSRAVFATLLAILALAVLWIIAGAIGRLATVRGLLDYFRRDVACNVSASTVTNPLGHDDANSGTAHAAGSQDVGSNVSTESSPPPSIRSLLALNFLRLAVDLGAILAFVGAAILCSFASPAAHPHPGLPFILYLPFAAAISVAWPTLNWYLSLASIFAIRDGDDTFAALSAAATFCRDRAGAVFAVSVWTGLAHLVAFSAASTAASVPLAFAQFAPARLVIAAIILATLVYLAIVDWLYIARLAGYVCITEMPEAVAMPASLPIAPPSDRESPPLLTIDRDEPILSDLPNLAVET
jgi:hypothetical protein